ncbi:hypothetical protein ACFQ3B_08190 [Stackebrandtia endophytica]|uniref:hypothetical protein n=1 Tax=Stackebrandtia endophytica TaxID=1496996 RepID=UPI001476BD3B|nr:hypothetical protein [Stackebrandtia endophytica]
MLVARDGRPVGSYVVKDREAFRKRLTHADVGDVVGVWLANAQREDLIMGDVLTIR